jgi:holliday junction DNA helicase RuvA
MIAQIKGQLVEKSPTEVVIDCHGVGYCIHISLHTYSLLPQQDLVSLYTHLLVREDSHTLYGFAEKSEREIFKLLLSVSGIGANTARTMLSSISPDQIINALASGDVGTIQSIKGIGIKTAQRAILDLKDRVSKLFETNQVSLSKNNINREEALSAMEVLGFIRKNAEKVIDKIIKEEPEASLEMLIKKALKSM